MEAGSPLGKLIEEIARTFDVVARHPYSDSHRLVMLTEANDRSCQPMTRRDYSEKIERLSQILQELLKRPEDARPIAQEMDVLARDHRAVWPRQTIETERLIRRGTRERADYHTRITRLTELLTTFVRRAGQGG